MSCHHLARRTAATLGAVTLLVAAGAGTAQADPRSSGDQHGQSQQHSQSQQHGQSDAPGQSGEHGPKPPKPPTKPKKPHPVHPEHPAHPAQSQSTAHSQAPTRAHGQAAPGASPAGQADDSSAAAGPQGPAQDPAGNNGTVKIAPLGTEDGTPDNTPHPGCGFLVEWYGFDEGADVVSTVGFAMQAPTRSVNLTVAGPDQVFVGGDPASGAGTPTGLDGRQAYRLSFDGAPHPQQGYHVKVTVSTPRSRGNDTKTKVFWVEPCAATAAGSPTTTTPEAVLDGDGARNGARTTEVVASAGRSTTVTPTLVQDVPTVVDAGAGGAEAPRGAVAAMTSAWGLGLVAGGLLLAAAAGAFLRRRRA